MVFLLILSFVIGVIVGVLWVFGHIYRTLDK